MLVGCSAVAKVHAEAAVGGGCNVCTLTVVVVVGIFCCFVANYCRASAIFRITSLHYATSVGCIVSSALWVACRHLSCIYVHKFSETTFFLTSFSTVIYCQLILLREIFLFSMVFFFNFFFVNDWLLVLKFVCAAIHAFFNLLCYHFDIFCLYYLRIYLFYDFSSIKIFFWFFKILNFCPILFIYELILQFLFFIYFI